MTWIPTSGAARTSLPWAALLIASELLYLSLLRLDARNGLGPVVAFLLSMAALFALYAGGAYLARSGGLRWIAAGAVLFRLSLLPAGLPYDAAPGELARLLEADLKGEAVVFERFQLFDDDIWRYLWDGHVSAQGANPYTAAPASVSSEGPWEDIRQNINYPEIPTLYPPLAQGLFRLSHAIAPGSVLAMKALLVAADLGACVFLFLTLRRLGMSGELVLLYAWNPLVIKVFAGSGHVDALAVFCLAALGYAMAAGWWKGAAIALALSILAKLFPAVLLPLVARRVGWRNVALLVAVVGLGYLPFAGAGAGMWEGLGIFAQFWRFNGGPFQVFEAILPGLGRTVAMAAPLGLACWLAWRGADFLPSAAWTLGTALILSPAVMPWYVTLLLPFSVLAGQRVWIYFSAAVCLAFHVMIDQREYPWVLALEYLPILILTLRSFDVTQLDVSTAFSHSFLRRGFGPRQRVYRPAP